jgi:hypothetical protein
MGMVVALKSPNCSLPDYLPTVTAINTVLGNIQTEVDELQKRISQIAMQITEFVPTEEKAQEQEESSVELDSDLITLISEVTETRVDRMSADYRLRVMSIERINITFEIILSDYFQDEEVDLIVEKLNMCRRIENFSYMRSVYELYKDSPSLRELLLAVCAMYRLNVKDYADRSASSGDRSIVKYAMSCPECGELATNMVHSFLSADMKM